MRTRIDAAVAMRANRANLSFGALVDQAGELGVLPGFRSPDFSKFAFRMENDDCRGGNYLDSDAMTYWSRIEERQTLDSLKALCVRARSGDPAGFDAIRAEFERRWNSRVSPERRVILSSDRGEAISQMTAYAYLGAGLDNFKGRADARGDGRTFERLLRESLARDRWSHLEKSALIAKELNPDLCPTAQWTSRCACLGISFLERRDAAFGEIESSTIETRIRPIVDRAESDFLQSIAESRLSDATKSAIRKYFDDHPIPLRPPGEHKSERSSQFNAFYSPASDSLHLSRGLVALMREHPEEGAGPVHATYIHEFGHRFASLVTGIDGGCASPDVTEEQCPSDLKRLAASLPPSDVRLLQSAVECIDSNMSRFENLYNHLGGESRESELDLLTDAQRRAKRQEAFADLFLKRRLRTSLGEEPSDEGFERVYLGLRQFCWERPTPSTVYLQFGHENDRTRVINLLNGIVPLSGDDLGYERPRECDTALW